MLIQFLLIFLGFVILWKSSDILVDGSANLAKRLSIPPFIIGLTLVAFGTSAPELVVNVIASFKGKSDITLGNVLGSNLANILLILGLTGIIYPLKFNKDLIKIKLPISIIATILLFIFFKTELELTLFHSSIFLLCFIGFIIYILLSKTELITVSPPEGTLAFDLIKTVAGTILLPIGGKLVIDPAIEIASILNISEVLISLIAVAIGTSLPELATSVNAALKKESDMAIGNIIGSNIFNIFLILGVSSFIHPITINLNLVLELILLISVSVIIWVVLTLSKTKILNRIHSGLLLITYFSYIAYSIYRG